MMIRWWPIRKFLFINDIIYVPAYTYIYLQDLYFWILYLLKLYLICAKPFNEFLAKEIDSGNWLKDDMYDISLPNNYDISKKVLHLVAVSITGHQHVWMQAESL